MRTTLVPLAIAAGCNAALQARHDDKCYFNVHTYGGVEGTVWQLDDGQCRTSCHEDSCSEFSKFYLEDGGIFDEEGRGCILTPGPGQWQCDDASEPTYGAFIKKDGVIGYNGKTEWWACAVDDKGAFNIYDHPVIGQDKCFEISLDTNGDCVCEEEEEHKCAAPKHKHKPHHPHFPVPVWKPFHKEPKHEECDCKKPECPKECPMPNEPESDDEDCDCMKVECPKKCPMPKEPESDDEDCDCMKVECPKKCPMTKEPESDDEDCDCKKEECPKQCPPPFPDYMKSFKNIHPKRDYDCDCEEDNECPEQWCEKKKHWLEQCDCHQPRCEKKCDDDSDSDDDVNHYEHEISYFQKWNVTKDESDSECECEEKECEEKCPKKASFKYDSDSEDEYEKMKPECKGEHCYLALPVPCPEHDDRCRASYLQAREIQDHL